MRGPQSLYFDPVTIQSITLCEAAKLEGNEAIVVYREIRENSARVANANPSSKHADSEVVIATDTANRVERRIVRGPTIFIPASNEWIHKFSWHGTVTDRGGSKTGYPGDTKVAHAVEFEKIRIMRDYMYLTVRDVRTQDDAKISLHLMLYYVLHDIETMLDNSNDPIGEFINAASADMMSFCANRTHDKLLEECNLLNDKEHFPILSGRMPLIGYELLKVAYRGYDTSSKLQELQDRAIASRTEWKLEGEILQNGLDRVEKQNELNEKKRMFALNTRQVEAEQERKTADALHTQRLQHEREQEEARLSFDRRRKEGDLAYLTSLKEQVRRS